MKPLKGITTLIALKDIKGINDCWNESKSLTIKAGERLTKDADLTATRYGHLFFSTTQGRFHPSEPHIETKSPYCTGYYNPDSFKEEEV